MSVFRQWIELWRETFRSIDRDDVAELYSRHWMPAQEALVAHDREAIVGDTRRWRRLLRTANAVIFGLTRRLAPVRRLILGLALAAVAVSLLAPVSWSVHSDRWRVTSDLQGFYLLAGFLLLLLLLGMELVDKLRFRDELELARDLQADLLPRQLPPAPGFETAAYNRIANTVGGDLYDFAPRSGGGLALLFGDASGHGMAAGLVMAVVHAACRLELGETLVFDSDGVTEARNRGARSSETPGSRPRSPARPRVGRRRSSRQSRRTWPPSAGGFLPRTTFRWPR
jgi:hypothetical protein